MCWREGTNEPLQSRFARVRVTVAHDAEQHSPTQECLIVEWPKGEKALTKCWLSNLPNSIDRPIDSVWPRIGESRRNELKNISLPVYASARNAALWNNMINIGI